MINATSGQQTDGSLDLENPLSKQTGGGGLSACAKAASIVEAVLLNVRHVDSSIQRRASQRRSQTWRDTGGIRGITPNKESKLVKAVVVEWLIDEKRADTKCETNGRIHGQTYK